MKKGLKKGALVTCYRWYMLRRVYGHVTAYLGDGVWAVTGNFGLESFYEPSIRVVKKPKWKND